MKKRAPAAFLVILGLIGFMNIARQPRFEQFHTVDVLQLMASGMCFGVALVAIMGKLKIRD